MPKIVDHHERRTQLAEAAWRIIRREGLEAVTVRNVAKEAGMSLGSLRHYFDSQSELLSFSMKLVSEQVYKRMEAIEYTGDPRKDIELLIYELMPLDDVRREEAEVWLAFIGRAAAEPEILALKQEVHNELYDGFSRMLHYLAEIKLVREGIDLDLEIMRLHALVDGLVVHHLSHPEQVTSGHMVRLVTYHLDTLLK